MMNILNSGDMLTYTTQKISDMQYKLDKAFWKMTKNWLQDVTEGDSFIVLDSFYNVEYDSQIFRLLSPEGMVKNVTLSQIIVYFNILKLHTQ